MFGLFKKKSQLEKLQAQYAKVMADYHRLSTTDRTASDAAYAKAEKLGNEIDALAAAK
ncbi:Lacal_2735 family protein [Nonlabens spongiae]|uniref:Lacal_2735 family protein n=1 Tax=Nonlabens spongiae TaxID=331648 RepID=UPI0012F4C9E9|nr:Lacal_2735 family protein [Nonlabens spongiae]